MHLDADPPDPRDTAVKHALLGMDINEVETDHSCMSVAVEVNGVASRVRTRLAEEAACRGAADKSKSDGDSDVHSNGNDTARIIEHFNIDNEYLQDMSEVKDNRVQLGLDGSTYEPMTGTDERRGRLTPHWPMTRQRRRCCECR